MRVFTAKDAKGAKENQDQKSSEIKTK